MEKTMPNLLVFNPGDELKLFRLTKKNCEMNGCHFALFSMDIQKFLLGKIFDRE